MGCGASKGSPPRSAAEAPVAGEGTPGSSEAASPAVSSDRKQFLESLFHEMDTDKNGEVDFEEYRSKVKSQTMINFFKYMDENLGNSDGNLSMDEWLRGMSKLGSMMSDEQFEKELRETQANIRAVSGEPPSGPVRYNSLRESPADAKYKLCVVQFKVPGAKNGGSDKGPDGNRIDSIPIANGVIAAGGACDLVLFDSEKNKTDVEEFKVLTSKYDALIVRINPGQLSQGTEAGTQQRFDELMNKYISEGKLVWSSPKIQTQMGAKDALVKIGALNCGLPDSLAYYTEEELVHGFKTTCAFQPRVIKQNRGSAGEGIWLCWLWDKEGDKKVEVYPSKSFNPKVIPGEQVLADDDYLKLMEMNDNHVEFHTVKEFMTFCVGGPEAEGAGTWTSTFPGKYLEGGKEAGGQLVDQRLLPRIDEGEVRILMAGDTCQMAIHKKPMGGGLSAVGGNSEYTYYKPTDAKYKGLVEKLYADIPDLLPSMDLGGEPLPLLWTCDYIPKNPDDWGLGPYDRSCPDDKTEYTVGEFNCSCVGISKFQAVCGGEKTLADVPDADYFDACELTDLMGVKAIEMLDKAGGK